MPASVWPGYFRVVFLLAALLCFCWLLLRLIGRRVNGPRGARGGVLELIDRLGLEPRRTLYIVRAGTRYLALASSESGIQLLAEVSPESVAAPVNPEPGAKS